MRIISGKAKNIKLATISNKDIQASSSRTKEALFSIIYSKGITGAFLDLFAGSGQIGLEAASRNFAPVVLVEKSKQAVEIINLNIKKTGLKEQTIVIRQDAGRALKRFQEDSCQFDLIFLDPPWASAEKIFYQLEEGLAQILSADGLVVLEHHKNVKSPDAVTVLEYLRSCNYGSAVLSFYKKVAL